MPIHLIPVEIEEHPAGAHALHGVGFSSIQPLRDDAVAIVLRERRRRDQRDAECADGQRESRESGSPRHARSQG